MGTKQAERQEKIERMRELVKPGDTLYTICDHVSKSGMSRAIRVVLPVTVERDGKQEIDHLHPNYLIAQILGLKQREGKDAMTVGGCGMDMGFHLIYSLGRALWPDGFTCTGKGCPSNDHSNGNRDYTGTVHHNDGGYALKQRWL